jgi:hypothetical protein
MGIMMLIVGVLALLTAVAIILLLVGSRSPFRKFSGQGYSVDLVYVHHENRTVKYEEHGLRLEFDAELMNQNGWYLSVYIPEQFHQETPRARLLEIEGRIRTAVESQNIQTNFVHLGSMSFPPMESMS